MRVVLLALLTATVALAGCTGGDPGSDDDRGDGAGTPGTRTTATDTTTSSSPSPTPTRQPQTHDVRIEDFGFHPADMGDMTVWVGDTVRWTNHDNAIHTVDSTDGGPLDSGDLAMGESYEFTFDGIGRFDYRCDKHPSMTGYVQVYIE